MSIKNQLFESFVKGVGKTVAALSVFSIIGSVYFISNKYYTTTKKRNEYEMRTYNNTQTDNSVYHDIEPQNETIQMVDVENKKPSKEEDVDYRKIFNF